MIDLSNVNQLLSIENKLRSITYILFNNVENLILLKVAKELTRLGWEVQPENYLIKQSLPKFRFHLSHPTLPNDKSKGLTWTLRLVRSPEWLEVIGVIHFKYGFESMEMKLDAEVNPAAFQFLPNEAQEDFKILITYLGLEHLFDFGDE